MRFYFLFHSLFYLFILLASLLNAYNKYKPQTSIYSFSGITFGQLHGFAMIGKTYFITDPVANRVYMFDENWNALSYQSFSRPAYMLAINNTVYISGVYNVYIADKDLNTLNQYNAADSPYYNGVYLNATSYLLYIVSNGKSTIDIFNLNLNRVDTISIAQYSNPYSIQGFNNNLYVGTYRGLILVISNKIVIRTFNGCNSNCLANIITSIVFDQFGYMATTNDASVANNAYLYDSNALLIGSFSVPNYLCDMQFDSKGRLIFVSFNQITIYN